MWIFFALLAAIIWGLDYALAEKVLKDKMSASLLLGCQMLLGSIVLLSFSFFVEGTQKVWATVVTHKWLFIVLLVSFVLGNLFVALSIKEKNATIAGVIEISYPLFSAIFLWLLFGEKTLTPGIIVGGLFIFLGIIVISIWN